MPGLRSICSTWSLTCSLILAAWNFAGLIMVYLIGKKRKFDGECFLFYFFWYGLGRAWIEGLRTDSLYLFGWELFGAPIRVSQLLAAATCWST